jgi:septum formation protein
LFLKSPHELILASTSKYRRELVSRFGIPFQVEAPLTDETPQPGERAATLVTRLARAKARAVGERHPNAWVIGSDQLAVRVDQADGERILGKPGNRTTCIEQLKGCSGQTLSFLTALAVYRHQDEALHEFTDTTRVMFRPLQSDAIERYVDREQPFDCAGGFKSEALGISLFESITSTDPSALIGLPLIRLAALLRRVGFELP